MPRRREQSSELGSVAMRAQSDGRRVGFRTATSSGVAVGSTLRLLRERRGLQSKQVADLLGRSPGYVSKAESGATEVTGESLDRYASVLDVPQMLLCESIPEQPPEGVHFRTQAVPQHRRHKVIADANFFGWVLNRLIERAEADIELPLAIPAIDADLLDGGAEEAAQLVRKKWRVYGPVRDIAGLLEQAGVFVLPMPVDAIGIDAVTVRTTGPVAAVVLLNEDVPEERKRHSLAHELAHLTMDEATVSRSLREDEERADAFAGEFLAPYSDLQTTLDGVTPTRLDELEQMRLEWGVSLSSLVRRAYLHGGLNESQYRYWFRVLNSRNLLRSRRATPHAVQPRAAADFLNALRDSGYGAKDVCDVALTSVSELQEMFTAAWPFSRLRPRLRVVARDI